MLLYAILHYAVKYNMYMSQHSGDDSVYSQVNEMITFEVTLFHAEFDRILTRRPA